MGKLLPSLIAAAASSSKMFIMDTRDGSSMQMTEFNIIPGQNGMASRQFDLDISDSPRNPCVAMSEGGTYLMVDDSSQAWKLGVCGWEAIPDVNVDRTRPVCGTVPGGAMFCGGKNCHYYSDATDSWDGFTQMPNYHTEGEIVSADGYAFVVGGQSATNVVDRYDPDSWTWTTLTYDETGLPKEYKGFSVAQGPHGDSFMTFTGFHCGHNADWTCGYNDDQFISYVNGAGIPIAVTSNHMVESVIEREVSSAMYRTFISRYDHNSNILINAQQVMCQGNNTGSLLDYASANMFDMSMVDEFALQENCNDNELQQPNFFELQYFTFDSEKESFSGPNFYWSYPRDKSFQFNNGFAFFWDESNLKNEDTCYIDRCEDNPCDDGQVCTWGWNDDEKSSWLLCDGEEPDITTTTTEIPTTTTTTRPATTTTSYPGGPTTTTVPVTTTTPTDVPWTTAGDDTTQSPGNMVHSGSCFVNNGGCTHDCGMVTDSTYTCECPSCWSMDDDGLTCYPSSESITTLCGPNEMVIRMNKCVLENSHDWTTAKMMDGDCAFTEDENDSDYVILRNGLDECGMELSYENNTLSYSNTLQVSSSVLGGMIVTKPGVTWDFSCDYDTEYEVGDELTVNAAAISQGFSQTNAQFSFSFDFYTDGSFEDIQDTNQYSVGQHINFGVTMNGGEALNNLDFIASKCEVSNGDLTYVVFDMMNPNHCSAAPPVFFQQHFVSDNPAASFYSYMGFQFKDDDDQSAAQIITCAIQVCHQEDPDSLCNMGCYEDISGNSTLIQN